MLSATALLWTRICAALALVVVANLFWSLVKLRRGASSSGRWPTAPGEIVASEVQVPRSHTSDADTDCSVAIRYSYRVAGRDYEGHHIHAGRDAMTTRQAAGEISAKYPRGAKVDVRYRPDRPATAVLEPKDTANFAGLIAMLVVFSAIAAVLIAHSIAGKVLYYREGGMPVFALLLPLAAIGVGIGGIFGYARTRRRLHESAHWPAATGAITSSTVNEVRETEKDHEDRETVVTKYVPDIRFSYTVGGREYHSSRWSWGWTALYPSHDMAQAVVDKHPTGQAVPVYYDPGSPESAVLEPANRQGTLAPLVFAAIFGGGGALMFWGFTAIGD